MPEQKKSCIHKRDVAIYKNLLRQIKHQQHTKALVFAFFIEFSMIRDEFGGKV